MIGYLKGKIIDWESTRVLVDVGGVGYQCQMPNAKCQIGDEIEIFVYTYVREDEISLYGFENKKQKAMFEMLIGVNGVGPKVAMGILSQEKVGKITEAISKADVGFFTRIKGIGKKGAQKIIIDLKNKIGSVTDLDLMSEGGDEVMDGLVAMGFDARKVADVLRELDEEMSEQEKIKLAIKKLSK